jgi:hypothetical protein
MRIEQIDRYGTLREQPPQSRVATLLPAISAMHLKLNEEWGQQIATGAIVAVAVLVIVAIAALMGMR